MTKKVVVIDYDVGNLLSVRAALEHCGAECIFTSDPDAIVAADRVLLPGVGAFGACVDAIRAKALEEPIRHFVANGRPIFGICVGMQMLMDESEEFGRHEGLGLIRGRVAAIPSAGIDGVVHDLPHIGWSELLPCQEWRGTVLGPVAPGASVYFVHSYAASPEDDRHRIADYDYDGHRIAAVIGRDNIVGAQFHPEKSGKTGLAILNHFLSM